MSLKMFLMAEIERVLDPIYQAEHEGQAKKVDQIKVADVVFPYENKDLLEQLTKRGNAIVNHKWEELHKIEQKI